MSNENAGGNVVFDGEVVRNMTGCEPVPWKVEWATWTCVGNDENDAYDLDTHADLDAALADRFQLLQSGWAKVWIEARLAPGFELPAEDEAQAQAAASEEPDDEPDDGVDPMWAQGDDDEEEPVHTNAEVVGVTTTNPDDGTTATVRRTKGGKAGKVSEVAQARIAHHDERLAKLGLFRPGSAWSTAGTVQHTEAGYEVGTAVLDEAYGRLRSARRRWEQRPYVSEACAALSQRIKAEERTDVIISVKEMAFDADGTFIVPSLGRVGMEIGMLKTFLPRVWGSAMTGMATNQRKHGLPLFPSAWEYLLSMPVDERSAAIDRTLKRASADCKVRLLLRRGEVPGVPLQCYGVVGSQYTRFDADKIADNLIEVFGDADMRGEVGYEPGSTDVTIDASYHADSDMVDMAAGDVYQVGFRFRSNDSGGGSIRGGGFADWNACLNFLILSHNEVELFRQVHKGEIEDVREEVEAAVAGMQAGFDSFAQEWGCLRTTPIHTIELWGKSWLTVSDALEYGVKTGKIDVGQSRDIAVEIMLNSHRAGGGNDDLASLVDAVTRYAHESLVADCVRDRIERSAGAMVPVLVGAVEATL